MRPHIPSSAPAHTPSPLREVYDLMADAVNMACRFLQEMAEDAHEIEDFKAAALALADARRNANEALQEHEIWLCAHAREAEQAFRDALEAIEPINHACSHVLLAFGANAGQHLGWNFRPCPAGGRCRTFSGDTRAYFAAVPPVDERALLGSMRRETIAAAAHLANPPPPFPEGGPDWWQPRPVPPLRLGSGNHAIGPMEFAVAPGGSATVDLADLMRSAEAQGRTDVAREMARLAERIVSGSGSNLPTPSDANRREEGTPLPDDPPDNDDDRALFLDFPTKGRLLLRSLWRTGNVAIQKVRCAVWPVALPKQPLDTLKKLIARTNGKLAEKDYNLQVQQEAETLKLTPVDNTRPTFPRRK